ncbi:MAG: iron-containing redox enzyme family protein [Gammaproteobacteria bacterium]|nr:iron-containing redox enzyme family protein [Gammaproteobacteria bacterium]
MDISTDENILFKTDTITKKNLCELNSFLDEWDQRYKLQAQSIPLFIETENRGWNIKQKKFFARAFYHVRGHFHDFLWYLGNHAPDKRSKEVILHNLMEEFGGQAQSHEKLYIHFAKSLDVQDINDEILEQTTYLPFIKEFNKGHLSRLYTHSWHDNLAIFSAYERLDNIDYTNLMTLVKNWGIPDKDSVFFKVHMLVEHFETTLSTLLSIWTINKQTVIDAFNFIASHQLQMWKNLSAAVVEYS